MSLTGAGLHAMKMLATGGTINALGELIDNSLQYSPNNVEVNVNFITSKGKINQIIVSDNGYGMSLKDGKETIDRCLWFGSGTSLNALKDISKYGIGLPFACCGQSTHYNVYSWREDTEGIMTVYRKHSEWKEDELVKDAPHEIINQGNIPIYVKKTCNDLLSNKSGTIIFWRDCDQLDYKKATTLKEHMISDLGRMYSRYINKGASIKFKIWDQVANSDNLILLETEEVVSRDHLFLTSHPEIAPYHSGASSNPWFDPKTHVLRYTDFKGINHEIKITASIVKEEVQKPGGKDDRTGNTPVGKTYGKTSGISLVRAGREISNGYFKFVNSQSEPRNRWWKIEVEFEPVSDEILAVGANKNVVKNFKKITSDRHDPTDDSNDLMYEITKIVEPAISEMMGVIKKRGKSSTVATKCPECKQGNVVKGKCNKCQISYEKCPVCTSLLNSQGDCYSCEFVTPKICPKHGIEFVSEGHCPTCGPIDREITETDKLQIEKILRNYTQFQDINEQGLKSLYEWFRRSGKRHFVLFAENPIAENELFQPIYLKDSDFNLVVINKLHSFYSSHVEPILEKAQKGDQTMVQAADSFILLVLSWAATELEQTNESRKTISLFRSKVGLHLQLVLSTWNAN